MKLSSENINAARNKIDRDIRMLECIDNMHKKMEYKVSCEDPNVSYISIDGLRLVFENGVYKGRYIFEEEEEVDENIIKLKKLIKQFFYEYLPPIDVDIYEYQDDRFSYTKITIHINQWDTCKRLKKYIIVPGSIEHLASLPEYEFNNILGSNPWVN